MRPSCRTRCLPITILASQRWSIHWLAFTKPPYRWIHCGCNECQRFTMERWPSSVLIFSQHSRCGRSFTFHCFTWGHLESPNPRSYTSCVIWGQYGKHHCDSSHRHFGETWYSREHTHQLELHPWRGDSLHFPLQGILRCFRLELWRNARYWSIHRITWDQNLRGRKTCSSETLTSPPMENNNYQGWNWKIVEGWIHLSSPLN